MTGSRASATRRLKYRQAGLRAATGRFYRVNAFREMIGPYAARGTGAGATYGRRKFEARRTFRTIST